MATGWIVAGARRFLFTVGVSDSLTLVLHAAEAVRKLEFPGKLSYFGSRDAPLSIAQARMRSADIFASDQFSIPKSRSINSRKKAQWNIKYSFEYRHTNRHYSQQTTILALACLARRKQSISYTYQQRFHRYNFPNIYHAARASIPEYNIMLAGIRRFAVAASVHDNTAVARQVTGCQYMLMPGARRSARSSASASLSAARIVVVIARFPPRGHRRSRRQMATR